VPQPTTVALAWWVIAAFCGLLPVSAVAQNEAPPTPPAEATPLGEITNSATRTPRRVDDVPATVTVVPADAVQRRGARDIKDLFRNEIDITVRAAPARFSAAGASTGRAGNEGINIRGLEGNQVLLLVDGIRVPNSFSFGAFATGRGDFFALDSAQSLEVLRGPASTQFGSDVRAGAVSLHTLGPADVLGPHRCAAAALAACGHALARPLHRAIRSDAAARRTGCRAGPERRRQIHTAQVDVG
jgi:hemoglobin/transferrin/lactoferrin receptor protein